MTRVGQHLHVLLRKPGDALIERRARAGWDNAGNVVSLEDITLPAPGGYVLEAHVLGECGTHGLFDGLDCPRCPPEKLEAEYATWREQLRAMLDEIDRT